MSTIYPVICCREGQDPEVWAVFDTLAEAKAYRHQQVGRTLGQGCQIIIGREEETEEQRRFRKESERQGFR